MSLYNLVVEKTGLFSSLILRSVGGLYFSVVSRSSDCSSSSLEPGNLIGDGSFFDGFPSLFGVDVVGWGASVST